MSNNRKLKSAFSFLIALIMIMQVITPVIAESIQKNDIKSSEVEESEEGLKEEEIQKSGENQEEEVHEGEETQGSEDVMKEELDNNIQKDKETESITSNEDKIDVISEDGNNSKVEKSLDVQSENEILYSESYNLKEIEGFNYNVTLYGDGKDLDDEIDINNIKEIQYLLKFTIEDNVKFTNNEYLELDISDLERIPEFKLDGLNEEKNLVFKVKEEGSNVEEDITVGSYNVVDGKVIIKFSQGEKLNDLEEREGSLSLDFTVNNEVKVENIIDVIELEGLEDKTYVIRRNTESKEIISKKGEYSEIEDLLYWTIDINKNLDYLENVIFMDNLDNRMTIVDIEIADLEVTTNGENAGTYKSIKEEMNIESNNISIDLGILDRQAKRIKITTKLNDEDVGDMEIHNEAKVKYNNDKQAKAEDTIEFNRGISINKSNSFINNEITWKIDFKGDVNEGYSKIIDTLTINKGSEDIVLILKDVKLNGENLPAFEEGIESSEYYKIDENKNIIFNVKNSTSTQSIEYKTKVIYVNANNKEYKLSNEAIYQIDNNKASSKSELSFKKGELNKKESGSDVYTDKDGNVYLDWYITINRNNENWEDVIVDEYIPKGFEFVRAEFNNEEKKVGDSNNTEPIKLKLGNVKSAGTLKVTIKLIDKNILLEGNNDKITNKAIISWITDKGEYEGEIIAGNGNSGDKKNKEEVIAGFDPNNFKHRLGKSNKEIKYYRNENENIARLSWIIDYVTFKDNINNLTITDTLSPGHEYDKESFKIYINDGKESIKLEEKVGFNSLGYKDLKYTLNFKNNEFTLNILGEESNEFYNRIVLEYDTISNLSKLDNENQNKLSNNVIIDNDGKKLETSSERELDTKVSKNGNKSGRIKKDRVFEWKAELNYKGKSINKITDTLEGNQIYDLDSIKIQRAKITENGSLELIEDGILEKDEDYEVKIIEKAKIEEEIYEYDKGMEITFTKEINDPFILTYNTQAVGISEEKYKNEIMLNDSKMKYTAEINYHNYDDYIKKDALIGNNDYVVKGDIIEWEVKINNSLSEIINFQLKDSLEKGLILIKDSVVILNKYKEDVTNKFDIVTDDLLLQISPNSEDKKIEENYILKYETLVSADEKIENISNTVEISGDKVFDKSVTVDTITVISRKEASGKATSRKNNEYHVLINKVDVEKKLITSSEATFKLITESTINGEIIRIEEEISTNKGILELKLEKNKYNKYYLQEIKAPDGYELSKLIYEINLEDIENEENIKEKKVIMDIVNGKSEEVIEVTAKKVWIGGPKEKPEIEIQLFKNGEKFGEPVKLKDKTEHTFKNLVIRDKDMDEDNIYTVDEVEVPRYYRKSISEDGLTITNTYSYTPSTEDPEDPDDRPYYPEEKPKNEEKVEKSKKTKNEESNEIIKPGSKTPPVIEDNTVVLESNKSEKPSSENNISKQPVNTVKELLPRTGIEGFNYIMILGFILLVFGVINLKKED